MTSRDALFENHTLLVRDGRILDILPSAMAGESYAAAVQMERPNHVLLPGLIDACASLGSGADGGLPPEQAPDELLLGIAAMLRAGTTFFCYAGDFPQECSRLAMAQGMRALIGMPIAAGGGPWARNADECLTRALSFRDELSGHPSVTTAFAPRNAATISDATFARIATLADELDAGILLSLHASRAEVEDSVAGHGLRPIARMHALGLLTPALVAAHMVHVDAGDIDVAQRSGLAVVLCPQTALHSGNVPPIASWLPTGLRLGLGSGGRENVAIPDLWSELRSLALLSRIPASDARAHLSSWDALATATCGAAAALGLEAEIGSLESGKWADICCVDLHHPAMLHAVRAPLPRRLACAGGRDLVNDVWVAGRQLLHDREFERLDWRELAARIETRFHSFTGDPP